MDVHDPEWRASLAIAAMETTRELVTSLAEFNAEHGEATDDLDALVAALAGLTDDSMAALFTALPAQLSDVLETALSEIDDEPSRGQSPTAEPVEPGRLRAQSASTPQAEKSLSGVRTLLQTQLRKPATEGDRPADD
jgi:hypothetical protein